MRHLYPLLILLGLSALLPAAEPATKVTERYVVLNGQQIKQSDLELAYQQVKKKFALHPTHRKLDKLGALQAEIIEGKAIELTGSRLILETSEGYVALMCKESPSRGDQLQTFAAKPLGTYSHRLPNGDRKSLAQYKDLTLTRTEFITHLRRGYDFGKLSFDYKRDRTRQLNTGKDKSLSQKKSGFKRKQTDLPRIKLK